MTPLQRLQELATPDRSRWKPMLAGLAAAIAGVEAVTLLKPSGVVLGMLVVLVFLAWFVGACAMLGFVRWFFASEFSRVKRDHADTFEKKDK